MILGRKMRWLVLRLQMRRLILALILVLILANRYLLLRLMPGNRLMLGIYRTLQDRCQSTLENVVRLIKPLLRIGTCKDLS